MLNTDFPIDLAEIEAILFTNKPVHLSKATLDRMNKSFEFLQKFAKNKVIYGVNTGFGPMAQYRIEEKDTVQLHYNLIRSHAAGSGKSLPERYVKALMLARLNTLSIGKSGIDTSVAHLLTTFINDGIYPVIFEHGGVGASGDLVQLAHLGLALIGEGEVFFRGKRVPTAQVFQQKNLQPIQIKMREGLAIMNGTSAMTGIGLINIIQANRLLMWSAFCGALLNEIASAYDDHFSEALNEAKRHVGQQEVSALMRKHLKDSKRIRKRENYLYQPGDEQVFTEKVQEYYSLRCLPQILGPITDTIEHAKDVLLNEVNSASDNPIIDVERQQVYHGGNFHGDYVALEMDKLKLAVTKISILSERQLNYLMNPKLNQCLPAFINFGKPGLNYGMQGAQFSAVSTTAENQALSNSLYVHSIPNNNDNQDVVSMGSNAAWMTKKVIDNTFEVLSTEVLALIQAVKGLKIKGELSSTSQRFMQRFAREIPLFEEDQPIYPYTEKLKNRLMESNPYEESLKK